MNLLATLSQECIKWCVILTVWSYYTRTVPEWHLSRSPLTVSLHLSFHNFIISHIRHSCLLKDDLKSPKSQRPGFGFIKRPCGALRESLSRSTGASSAELSCTCACTAISCLNYLWGSCVNAWALIYLARPDTQSAGINGNICVGGPAL